MKLKSKLKAGFDFSGWMCKLAPGGYFVCYPTTTGTGGTGTGGDTSSGS